MTKFEEEVKRPKKAYIDPFSKRDVDFTGVAKKFTEGAQTLKEWKEYAFLLEDKLKLQQQALPVVPECVGEFIDDAKGNLSLYGALSSISDNKNNELNNWVFRESHQNLFARAWLDGYTVEKPQLFYIELPNVYGLKNKVSVSKVENGTIVEFSNGKNYALKLTEQEIKSIDESYWQFAVPVEDGE